MPNSPNQATPTSPNVSSDQSDLPQMSPPYPQEQPPLLHQIKDPKDPHGGDKAAQLKQQTNHADQTTPNESNKTPTPIKSAHQTQHPAEKSKSSQTQFTRSQPERSQPEQSQPNHQQASQPQANQPQSGQVADQPEDELPPAYEESGVLPGLVKPQPEELLFEWQSKSRPFKKHNRQFFTSVGIIGLLIALILVFAGQWLPMAVVVAAVFVIYVFNTIPPGEVLQQATTYGIRVEEKLYYWEEMGRFWFTEKYGETLLNIEVARFPNRLTLLLGDLKKEDVEAFLSEILLNQQPPPTTYEKIADWLGRKLPLDLEN